MASYKEWENTQCKTCFMCRFTNGRRMTCEVFAKPYFVWEPAPKTCWAYCGSGQEMMKRLADIDKYADRKVKHVVS